MSDELTEQVADRLGLYWGPGDPLSLTEQALIDSIALIRADERTRIAAAIQEAYGPYAHAILAAIGLTGEGEQP